MKIKKKLMLLSIGLLMITIGIIFFGISNRHEQKITIKNSEYSVITPYPSLTINRGFSGTAIIKYISILNENKIKRFYNDRLDELEHGEYKKIKTKQGYNLYLKVSTNEIYYVPSLNKSKIIRKGFFYTYFINYPFIDGSRLYILEKTR